MKIFTVMFDVDKTKTWTRLLDVFKKSVSKNMPGAFVEVVKIPAPKRVLGRSACMTYNTVKLDIWNKHMQEIEENTIFIDADMMCLQPVGNLFKQKFDVALTFTNSGNPPLNAGVVIAKPTDQARGFFERWSRVNRRMYSQPSFHSQYVGKYLGMNQAALGYMIDSGECEDILRLDTRKWNSVDTDWQHVDEETVFVHIKGALRNSVMQNVEPYGELAGLMKQWYEFDGTPGPKRKKAIYLHGAYTRRVRR